MKEIVTNTKHPLMVGICVAVIAAGYIYLLANGRHPEPGPNLVFDAEPFEHVDDVETRFVETAPIVPDLDDPRGLTSDQDGSIYVAGKDEIQVLEPVGTVSKRIPISGTPTCIALAPGGDIVLGVRDHISIVRVADATQTDWPALGARAYLTSIVVNSNDVYAADAGNRVVLRFGMDGSMKARIGEADPTRDVPGLQVPSPYLDVAFDNDGALWVSNPGLLGMESYRDNGDLITSWYRPSLKLDGFSGCCNPSQIAFRGDGKLITCEKGLVRVKVYDATSGEFEELVAGSRLFPREQAVRDLAVDSAGRILVLDSRQNTIRVFVQENNANETIHQPA